MTSINQALRESGARARGSHLGKSSQGLRGLGFRGSQSFKGTIQGVRLGVWGSSVQECYWGVLLSSESKTTKTVTFLKAVLRDRKL